MKVYDCITFLNEEELLELRLNILNKYVDFFVICEAREDHRGNSKKLKPLIKPAMLNSLNIIKLLNDFFVKYLSMYNFVYP